MDDFGGALVKICEIIWLNVILSGDNAVVIAMACRGLAPAQRRTGMVLGAGVAVLLRIVFTVLIATLLTTPFLKLLGGLLLLWVAVKLLTDEAGDESNLQSPDRIWGAVRTVAIADAVMSLDNVLAIAAVAQDSVLLLFLGLAISIPLIVAGASLIMQLLDKLPLLVWAGAALLGWIAGDMMLTDSVLTWRLDPALVASAELPAACVGALLVLAVAALLRRRSRGDFSSDV
jgi:YjbE family integral membrane protein